MAPNSPTSAEEKKDNAISTAESEKHKIHTPSTKSKSKNVIVISPWIAVISFAKCWYIDIQTYLDLVKSLLY